jgi:two-component system response regulator PilR (NtrC family)
MQVKLLRAIQERAVRPVGAAHEEAVDVRIISATHKDLPALVETGDFRQDLYYRLNVIQLDAPPLRQHVDDIPLLASAILQRLSQRDGIPPRALSPAALAALQSYNFPGNVRELENILERTLALGESGDITASELSFPAQHSGISTSAALSQPNAAPIPQSHAPDDEHTLIQTLETHRWNRTRAAEALGLTLRQLRYRLEKMGLK